VNTYEGGVKLDSKVTFIVVDNSVASVISAQSHSFQNDELINPCKTKGEDLKLVKAHFGAWSTPSDLSVQSW
jgi:hypothetical protein